MVIAGQRTGDRNLLFGILAMQLDFVCQATLVTAMQDWLLDHSRSLGEVLEENGQLSPHRRQLLESLVDEHLAQHKDDVQESLAACPRWKWRSSFWSWPTPAPAGHPIRH